MDRIDVNGGCAAISNASKASNATDFRLMPVIRRWYKRYRLRRKVHQQRVESRLAFESMLDMDDAVLADIGVTRQDLMRARRLPLSVNAAVELQLVALENREVRKHDLNFRFKI